MSSRRSFFILVLLGLSGLTPAAGQDTAGVIKARDNNYIERFDQWMVVKLTVENSADDYTFDTGPNKFVFVPNPSKLFRAYFSYRFLSFYLTYAPRFLPGNNDDAEKGKSKTLAFGTHFTSHQWFTALSYSFTRGFYLQNTKDFRPNWQSGDPYFQVPKLQAVNFEGSTGYNTNPRLSLNAVYSQTERQMRSAGAFLPILSYSYFILDNRDTGFSQKANNFQLLLGAGYHHTFVVDGTFYFFGSFVPSFGYINTRLLTRDPATGYHVSQSTSPIYQWEAKAGFGYNAHRFFAGAYVTATSTKNSQGLTAAVNGNGRVYLQLFVGYRLQAPRILKETMDKIFH